MTEFLTKTFYNNTILEWLISLSIIVGSFIVGKALYWFFGNIVKKLTKKTKTKVDDIIVDMIEEPIVFALVLIGIWSALQFLHLPELAYTWSSKVYHILIVLNISWLLVRLVDSFFNEYLIPLAEKTDTDLDDLIVPILRKGLKFIIWALGIVVGLNNAGYDVGAIIAGLGIGGLALAMAAKDTVSNMFGGVTIFADKPFMINDRIRISGFDGTVKEIGIRSTRLQTLDGTIVTIPNSTFSGTPVENVTLEPSRKIVLTLGLTYDTSKEKMQLAMDILKKIGTDNPNVVDPVLVSFTNFGAYSLDILFIYFIAKESDILGTMAEMDLEILKQFNENGLEFAFPTQTIHNIQQKTT